MSLVAYVPPLRLGVLASPGALRPTSPRAVSRAVDDRRHRPVLILMLVLCALLSPRPTRADDLAAVAPPDVDVALVLAADVSLSMDEGELTLQRQGYAEALESGEVIAAIASGRRKRIAVTYFEWGGVSQQVVVAPWAIIDSSEAARRLAAVIRAAPPNSLDRTAVGEALAFANRLFDETALRADRRVVDISGDGISNIGRSVTGARAALIDRGVTVNALPIMPKKDEWSTFMPTLDAYYDECVVGGLGAFTLPVEGMEAFASGMRMKLILEIAGIPRSEPRLMPAAGPAPVRCQDFD